MADASSSNPHDMQVPQVAWEYPREDMQGETFKLVLSGKETIIALIKQRLGSYEGVDVSTALKKTVFAEFMRLPDVVVKSNKCIHYLVSREAVFHPDPDPTTVYYKVNGQMVRFGRMEFALVTGLRFGPSNIDPYARNEIPALSVYRRLFGAKPTSPVTLWNWYKDDKHFIDLPYEDCLQISQVLIAALLVLGLDPTSSKIPDFVWVLIENQKDFNKFPWGSLSFQILVKALKNVKHQIASNGYHLIGNTLAFLAWIYEALPLVGSSVGGREGTNRRPRFLRYTYDRQRSYNNIDTTKVNCFLEPDHKEIRHRFLKTVEPQGTDFALKYDQQKLRGVRGTIEGAPGPSSSFALPIAERRRAAGIRGEAEVGPEGDAPDDEDAVYPLTVRRKRELVDEIVEKAAKRVKEDLVSSQFAETVASLVFEKVKQFLSVGTGNRTSDGGETSTQRDDVVLTEIVERDTDDHARVETNTDARVEAASDARVEADTDARVPADTDDHALGEHDEQPVEETVDTEQDHDMAGGSAQKHQLVDEAITVETPSTARMADELQSIHEFQREVQDAEELEAAGGSDMSLVLVTPPATKEPPTQPATKRPSSQAVDEHKQAHKKAKVDVQYTRVTRKRKPGPALKSPFRPTDVRGTDFQRWLDADADDTRNVGLVYGVDREYFRQIMDLTFKLENVHLDPYIAILATAPEFAGVRSTKPRKRIMGTSFMLAIQEVWQNTERYGMIKFEEEEAVSEEHLERLSKFVNGLMPKWGGIKSWHDADEVIMVCNFDKHWATCVLNLVHGTLEIWDSNQHIFYTKHYEMREDAFRPVARIVPQVLKYMGFYNNRKGPTPTYSQWVHFFPEAKNNVIKQNDSESCGPLALKYAENRLRGVRDQKMTKADVKAWRHHIAECTYKFSTDSSTIEPED